MTATSTFANANSAASIIPAGPPPAITTACSVIANTHTFHFLRFRTFFGLRPAIMG